MTTDAIVPVGKDCDCGHPLIWRNNQQRCAVYGRHPAAEEIACWGDQEARIISYRNRNAPGARLIAMSLNTINNAPGAVRHRQKRAQAYAHTCTVDTQDNPHGCASSDTQARARTIVA